MGKKVGIFGASGQVGYPMAKNLLKEGHQVVAISRSKNAANAVKLDSLAGQGASLAFCTDYSNVDAVSEVLKGCDVVVVTIAASKLFVENVEPKILEAAVKVGVKRFVPTEFGCHTYGLPMGAGAVFDFKKKFQEKLFKSGIDWTLIYNGGIYDYFLPNLRSWEQITTFGNLELPIYTHDIEDIGRVAARAVVDDRTANKCVQMDYIKLTQTEMLALLKRCWPDYPFKYIHHSTEYITEMMTKAGDSVSAKVGQETDKERWGINNVVYIRGGMHCFDGPTVRCSELYPNEVLVQPETVLKNAAFVFA